MGPELGGGQMIGKRNVIVYILFFLPSADI